jgi:hypothetical protein
MLLGDRLESRCDFPPKYHDDPQSFTTLLFENVSMISPAKALTTRNKEEKKPRG